MDLDLDTILTVSSVGSVVVTGLVAATNVVSFYGFSKMKPTGRSSRDFYNELNESNCAEIKEEILPGKVLLGAFYHLLSRPGYKMASLRKD